MDFRTLLYYFIQWEFMTLVESQLHKGLHFKIDEESPVSSDIGSIEHSDCGRPIHLPDARITNYRLVSENSMFLNHIEINKVSGKMTFRHSIDRDSLCQKMNLCCDKLLDRTNTINCIVQLKAVVEVTDNDGSPLSTSYCDVNIEINDINDNSPVFARKQYSINISEATRVDSIILLPIATDADSAKYAVLKYYIKETSRYFRVEYSQDSTGIIVPKLVVQSRLDREIVSDHQLVLVAVDTGLSPRSGSLHISVRILDENDNEPIIQPVNPLSVKEDVSIGQFISRIQADDIDAGENALLSYYMKEHSSRSDRQHFKINERTGEITLMQKLDYDVMYLSPHIELTVTVKDNGQPKSLSSSTTLTINVIDVNDEVPNISIIDLFSRQPAKPEIRENLVHNQFVAFVNVRDNDHGLNGQVKCELMGEPTDFSLETIEHNTVKNRFEFKIITKNRLDCEKQPIHKLLISCHDMGHPKLSSQEEVIVKVIDLNDNSPTFGATRIELELLENQPIGSLVAILNITDLDETDRKLGKFQYVICENGKRYFRIEPIERRGIGEYAKVGIYTLLSFDREVMSTVEFDLIVKDVNWGNGIAPWQSLSSTSTIIVNILDLNDNRPIFSKSQYEFYIIEEKNPGQFVGLIQATDDDQGKNGKILYRMEDYSNNFLLDANTGSLITNSKIDREKVSVFVFKILASDQGRPSLSSLVNVVVRVNDVNDHDPKFIYPTLDNHTLMVSVYNSERSLILKVNAIDYDENSKNQITYSIDGGDETGLFQIDLNQGGISFTRKPKATDTKSYFLIIKASDNDYPIRSSKITIHLKLDESGLPYPGQDYRRGNNNQGDNDDQFLMDPSNRNKLTVNRNILLVICLIVISVTVPGLLLMFIICLRRRPQPSLVETLSQQNFGKNSDLGAHNNDSSNASNIALNYRMIPTDKYQELIHDNHISGYSGLSNININNISNNDPTLSLTNNGSDGYQWINTPGPVNIPMPGDNAYQKIISTNIEQPMANTGDQIVYGHDDAPGFLSSYGCLTEQQIESDTSNGRYQTLRTNDKLRPSNPLIHNEAETNWQDRLLSPYSSTGTPKGSFIASSFV